MPSTLARFVKASGGRPLPLNQLVSLKGQNSSWRGPPPPGSDGWARAEIKAIEMNAMIRNDLQICPANPVFGRVVGTIAPANSTRLFLRVFMSYFLAVVLPVSKRSVNCALSPPTEAVQLA